MLFSYFLDKLQNYNYQLLDFQLDSSYKNRFCIVHEVPSTSKTSASHHPFLFVSAIFFCTESKTKHIEFYVMCLCSFLLCAMVGFSVYCEIFLKKCLFCFLRGRNSLCYNLLDTVLLPFISEKHRIVFRY